MNRILLPSFTLSVLMLPTATHAGWFGPDSYEECMLQKMNGQNSSMYPTAHVACATIFKREEELQFISDVKKEWCYNKGYITITITENPTTRDITKGRFSFSPKDCTETKDDDFGAP